MDILDIPFNAFLKIEKLPPDSLHVLRLAESPALLNHLGTVHAAAQLALAEACSGEWLIRAVPHMTDKAVGVLRRVDAKFKNPMRGGIFSRAKTSLDEVKTSADPLLAKGRALIPVTIEIVDAADNVGLVATFEWFCQTRE